MNKVLVMQKEVLLKKLTKKLRLIKNLFSTMINLIYKKKMKENRSNWHNKN